MIIDKNTKPFNYLQVYLQKLQTQKLLKIQVY